MTLWLNTAVKGNLTQGVNEIVKYDYAEKEVYIKQGKWKVSIQKDDCQLKRETSS